MDGDEDEINMDGDEDEINIDDIVVRDSGEDSDDEFGLINLHGWLLLNRESAEQERGGVAIPFFPKDNIRR